MDQMIHSIQQRKMQLPFLKYHSNGNNFIILDERTFDHNNMDYKKLAMTFCNPKLSVGADGILVLQSSTHADLRMRLFEQDGTESDMCGNGIKCVMTHLCNTEHITSVSIETRGGIFTAHMQGSQVEMNLGHLQDPYTYVTNHPLTFTSVYHHIISMVVQGRVFYLLNIGEPHAVVIDHPTLNLAQFMNILQDTTLFPVGINLNVLSKIDEDTIRVRTFERGVWNYTSSCGTGSLCSAVVARHVLNCNPHQIIVKNDIGEQIIFFRKDGIYSVSEAHHAFTGVVEIDKDV